MLTHQFTTAEARVLLVTFAPSVAQNKFLFQRATDLKTVDVLAFNDTSDNFYVDYHHQVATLIDEQCEKANYEKLVIAGFSAGAFIACATVPNLKFAGTITVHSFSPHIRLATPHSTARQRLQERSDLQAFHLIDVINQAKPAHQFHLYFTVDSMRDGVHLRDSFELDGANVKRHYLNCGHDTTAVVRGDYPTSLQPMIDGSMHIAPQFIATADQILKCLMLTELGTAELDDVLSPFANPTLLPREFAAEFCYWHSRQLVRLGQPLTAIQWGWAAVAKSPLPCPDNIPETLGNIAFDQGQLPAAMDAYYLMANPTPEVSERLLQFGHLGRSRA